MRKPNWVRFPIKVVRSQEEVNNLLSNPGFINTDHYLGKNEIVLKNLVAGELGQLNGIRIVYTPTLA